MNKSLLSSQTHDWATPQSIVDSVEALLGITFSLDPCAYPSTAKAPKYYTALEDGLAQDWGDHTCWVNPPYGKHMGQWAKKASQYHSVVLVPARTDTGWWHEYAMGADVIYLIRGRLRFEGAEHSAPFPSALLHYSRQVPATRRPIVQTLTHRQGVLTP